MAKGNHYRFRVTAGGEYYCVATNDLGNETSSVIHLPVNGFFYMPLYWGAIPVGCIVFACLFSGLWCFRSKQATAQHNQSQKRDVQMPAKEPHEELHYGEICFYKKSSQTSSASVQENKHQETVYAEVKVSKRENSPAPNADSSDSLCNQKKEEKML